MKKAKKVETFKVISDNNELAVNVRPILKAHIESLHAENARLRAQVAELIEAGQEALNVIWVENLVAKEEGNIRYEATTKAVYDKLQAAIAAAEGGKGDA